jgi:CHASE2 domain-containing sensor protein
MSEEPPAPRASAATTDPAAAASKQRPKPGIWKRIKDKGFRYWATAAVVFFVTISGSDYIYNYLRLSDVRSWFYQTLMEWGPNPPEPKFVTPVLINDDEYWLGYPAGRRPLKRDYLAQIVDKLVLANTHVIALDIDTRLPDPTSMKIPADYRDETITYILAIRSAAKQGKKIVLATPISGDEQRGYQQDPDAYQAYGLCRTSAAKESTGSDFADAGAQVDQNITCGYISLPYDPLALPGRLPLKDGRVLDSFALEVARAQYPGVIKRLLDRIGTSQRYGRFVSADKFRQADALVYVHSVLDGTTDKHKLEARAVIVGGDWSTFAANRGGLVDLHPTPTGPIVGALLQANFAETFIAGNHVGTVPHWGLRGAEILFSLVAAIVFAVLASFGAKLAGVAILVLVLFFVQWLVLHGFGVFFDALVPVLGLGLHSLYERLVFPHEGHPHSN